MGCPLSVQAGASRWGWCSTTPRSTWPTTFPGEFRLNAKVGAEPGRGCQTQGTERSGGVMRPGPGPVPEHDPRAVQRYRAKVLDRIVAACADGSLDPSELSARSEAAQQATTPSALNAVIAAGFRVDTGFAAAVFGRTSAVFPPGRPGALTPVIRLRSVAVLGNVLTSQVPPAS